MMLTIFSVIGIFFDVRSAMENPEDMKWAFKVN